MIFEADITGCYDNISKNWIIENIPMDKRILKSWLDAEYIEKGIRYPSRKGVPQGGIISPIIANIRKPPGIETPRRMVRTLENTPGWLYPASPGIFAMIIISY